MVFPGKKAKAKQLFSRSVNPTIKQRQAVQKGTDELIQFQIKEAKFLNCGSIQGPIDRMHCKVNQNIKFEEGNRDEGHYRWVGAGRS